VRREAQVAQQGEEAAEVEALVRALRARRKEVADAMGMVSCCPPALLPACLPSCLPACLPSCLPAFLRLAKTSMTPQSPFNPHHLPGPLPLGGRRHAAGAGQAAAPER
jgi:hypothetical protein